MGKVLIAIIILTFSLNLNRGFGDQSQKSDAVNFFIGLQRALQDTSDITGNLAKLAKAAEVAVNLVEPQSLAGNIVQSSEKLHNVSGITNSTVVNPGLILDKLDNLNKSISDIQVVLTNVGGVMANPTSAINTVTNIIAKELIDLAGLSSVILQSIEKLVNNLIVPKNGTINVNSSLSNINGILSGTIVAVSNTIVKILTMMSNNTTPNDIISIVIGDLMNITKNITNNTNNIIGSITIPANGTVGVGIGGNVGVANNTIGSGGNLTSSGGGTSNNATTNPIGSVGSPGNLTSSGGGGTTSNNTGSLKNTTGNPGGGLGNGTTTGSTGNSTTPDTGSLNNATASLHNNVSQQIIKSPVNLTSSAGNISNNNTDSSNNNVTRNANDGVGAYLRVRNRNPRGI